MAPSEKCDPVRRKRSGRGFGKNMAPSGVRCTPGGLEAWCAWRLVSSTRRCCWGKDVWLVLDMRGIQGFYDTLKVGLLVFLELWLGTYPLSCSSCSSAIPSSTGGMPFPAQLEECHVLNPYPELNSRDTFRAQLKEHQQADL